MNVILALLQFAPLSIFLGVARHFEFSADAWPMAFQFGAIAALVEFAILIPIMKNKLNRLIAGANLFLITGGVGFFLKNEVILNFLGHLRASALFFFVGVACLIATFTTSTGVFEAFLADGKERRKSLYYLAAIAVVFAWSYFNRHDSIAGGLLPFVFLIFFRKSL